MSWEKVKLGDVIEKPLSGEWGEEGDNVFVIRTTNFSNDGSLDLEEVVKRNIPIEKVKRKRLIFGDTILEKSGGSPSQPVGRVVYFNIESQKPYLCNNFTSVLRPLKVVNPRYLFWFLFNNHITKQTLRYQNKTTGIINLQTERYLNELQIPLPPLSTQQKIASILDKADQLRKKDKQLLVYYDGLLQSIFYDMFGDPVKNEKIGEVKKLLLREFSEIVSGVAKNGNTIQKDFIEVPYMRVANVQDSHIVLDEIKTLKVSQRDFDKYLLKKDDILLTEGGDPDKLGRGAVWHNEINPCIHQNHVFRVRADFNIVNPVYLSFHIGSTYGKSYFLKAAKQTTGIASINITQLKNFKAILPPISLQNQFAAIAQNIQQQKQQIKKQQQQSEALFQVLLQRAFKEELIR